MDRDIRYEELENNFVEQINAMNKLNNSMFSAIDNFRKQEKGKELSQNAVLEFRDFVIAYNILKNDNIRDISRLLDMNKDKYYSKILENTNEEAKKLSVEAVQILNKYEMKVPYKGNIEKLEYDGSLHNDPDKSIPAVATIFGYEVGSGMRKNLVDYSKDNIDVRNNQIAFEKKRKTENYIREEKDPYLENMYDKNPDMARAYEVKNKLENLLSSKYECSINSINQNYDKIPKKLASQISNFYSNEVSKINEYARLYSRSNEYSAAIKTINDYPSVASTTKAGRLVTDIKYKSMNEKDKIDRECRQIEEHSKDTIKKLSVIGDIVNQGSSILNEIEKGIPVTSELLDKTSKDANIIEQKFYTSYLELLKKEQILYQEAILQDIVAVINNSYSISNIDRLRHEFANEYNEIKLKMQKDSIDKNLNDKYNATNVNESNKVEDKKLDDSKRQSIYKEDKNFIDYMYNMNVGSVSCNDIISMDEFIDLYIDVVDNKNELPLDKRIEVAVENLLYDKMVNKTDNYGKISFNEFINQYINSKRERSNLVNSINNKLTTKDNELIEMLDEDTNSIDDTFNKSY